MIIQGSSRENVSRYTRSSAAFGAPKLRPQPIRLSLRSPRAISCFPAEAGCFPSGSLRISGIRFRLFSHRRRVARTPQFSEKLTTRSTVVGSLHRRALPTSPPLASRRSSTFAGSANIPGGRAENCRRQRNALRERAHDKG
jgi:hypothetical protein